MLSPLPGRGLPIPCLYPTAASATASLPWAKGCGPYRGGPMGYPTCVDTFEYHRRLYKGVLYERLTMKGKAIVPLAQALSEAMSITKRYLTSLLSMR
jgi:hypothetical protein